jgi:hypothetical protein
MVSQVSPVFPVYGNPTTVSVRQNFGFTKAEIEALQNLANNSDQGPWLPLRGGNLTGAVNTTIAGGTLFTYTSGAAPTNDYNTTSATAGTGIIRGRRNSITRWGINLGNSGGDATNHFSIENFNDAGVSQGTPFVINRASGLATLNSGLSLGSVLAPTVPDLSKHISLYPGFGFNVTSGRLNYIAPTGSTHVFTTNGVTRFFVSDTQIYSTLGLVFSPVVAASPTDNSKHIELYTGYGLNITGNRLNINVGSTAGIIDVIGGVDKLVVSNTAVTATVPVVLPADPGSNLHASTKQYVDNLVTRSGGPWLPLTGGTLSGVGLAIADTLGANNSDLSKHIRLHSAGYGFNVTGGRLNAVAGTFNVVIGGLDKFAVNNGETIFNSGAGSYQVSITGASGSDRSLAWKTGSLGRFAFQILAASTESTGNAGSNLSLNRYADAGTLISEVWNVNRATGITTYTNGISFGTNVGATVADTSKHIVLHTNGYGFSVTSGRLNILTSTGASVVFNINATDRVAISYTNVTSQIPIVLPSDPTNLLEAATKQYVDNTITRAGGPFLPLIGGTVTGATTFSAAGTALTITNNATVGGTLTTAVGTVTGALTAGSGTINGNTIIAVHPTATTAQLYLRPASSPGVNGMESKLRFGGTFSSGTDYGPRFIASIRAGMVAAWGTEYLDIWTGTTTNDISSDVNQARIARFQNAGITFDKAATFSSTIIGNTHNAPGATALALGTVTSGEVLRINDIGGVRSSRFDLSYNAAGNMWIIGSAGGASHVSISALGAGVVYLQSAGATQFRTGTVASTVNYLQASGSITATNPILEAIGSDTNIGIRITPKGSSNVAVTTNTLTVTRDPQANLEVATKQYVDFNINTAGGQFLPLSGGTLLGMLELPTTTPTLGTHATHKTYVDGRNALYLPLTGGAIVGSLSVSSNVSVGGILTVANVGNIQVKATTNTRLSLFATAAPTDAKIVDMFLDGNGNLNMQFVNDAFNTGIGFFQAQRSGYATTALTLTAPVIGLNGSVNTGFLYPSGATTTTGFVLYADATYRYIRFTTDGWRLLFNASNGNLSFDKPSGANNVILYNNGDVWAAGNITANTYLFAVGNIMANGSIYPSNSTMGGGFALFADANDCNIRFTTDNWRIVYQRSTGVLMYWHPDGYSLFSIDGAGNTWSRGNVTANVDVYGQSLHASSRVFCNDIMNVSGTFYVANNYAYYLQRNTNGTWYFVEGGTINFSVGSNGDCNARAGIFANPVFSYGALHWGNDFAHYLGNGGNGQLMNFSPGHYYEYNNSTGTMIFWLANTMQWIIHADSSCYNNRAWTGGRGPYVDVSDIRAKRNVTSSTYGLSEILKLNPIRFQRIPIDEVANGDRVEVGFSAQDVQPIMPEAIFNINVPDEKGVTDETNPTFGLATTPIVAALVNAVKTLTARIEQLEATIH